MVTARVERVEMTLFVTGGGVLGTSNEDVHHESSYPLARVSARRVSLDARAGILKNSGETEARASAVVEAAHFNARVAAWEPVVEPWEVAARYEREMGHRPHVFTGSSPGALAFGHIRLRPLAD